MESHEGDSTGPLPSEARGHDHESRPDSHAPHHYAEHDTKLRRSAAVPVAPVILSTTAIDEAVHDPMVEPAPPDAASAEAASPPLTPVNPRAPPTA
jgi:hypothetical protein